MNASLLREALELPTSERLQLLEELWESLRGEPEAIELTDTQRRELDARLDDIERNPGIGRCWPEVRADLESRRR